MNNVSPLTIPVDHPAFAGHFPDNPTVPGVVLLDLALHAITTATRFDFEHCEISTVKFLKPVLPNEQVFIHHTELESGAIKFEVLSGTQQVAIGRVINNASKKAPST